MGHLRQKKRKKGDSKLLKISGDCLDDDQMRLWYCLEAPSLERFANGPEILQLTAYSIWDCWNLPSSQLQPNQGRHALVNLELRSDRKGNRTKHDMTKAAEWQRWRSARTLDFPVSRGYILIIIKIPQVMLPAVTHVFFLVPPEQMDVFRLGGWRRYPVQGTQS